ncbi:MAG: NUDIX domain-containing protein [Candidatus Pacebacteria bacterium]|nr:NUDIX domain-containing protein [Candidatus Paceibacterota bacterium]
MDNKNIILKVRGVIIHDSKLLIVKHIGTDFMALPGGHLKFREDIISCLKRELIDELGVIPEIGRLLYINTFMEKSNEYIEFFFEVKNGKDYLNIDGLERTHARELTEILWVHPSNDIEILPKKFNVDFKNNKIFNGEIKFINEL